MLRTTLYVRLLLVIAILAFLAVALGTEPVGPDLSLRIDGRGRSFAPARCTLAR